jgi:hypothetical protein
MKTFVMIIASITFFAILLILPNSIWADNNHDNLSNRLDNHVDDIDEHLGGLESVDDHVDDIDEHLSFDENKAEKETSSSDNPNSNDNLNISGETCANNPDDPACQASYNDESHNSDVSENNVSGEYNQSTLLSADTDYSGYGFLSVGFSKFYENDFGVLIGAGGGLLINHSIVIGIAGFGNTVDLDQNPEFDNQQNSLFAYGGGYVEYIFFPEWMIHFSASVLVGSGVVAVFEESSQAIGGMVEDKFHTLISDDVFVLEPAIYGQLNIARWFRITVGISYRLVYGLNMIPGAVSSDYKFLSGSIALQFGWF